MAHLVKIGNSLGSRIPKSLIEQAHFEGKELKLQVVRESWKEAITQSLVTHGQEPLDEEWVNLPLASGDEIEW